SDVDLRLRALVHRVAVLACRGRRGDGQARGQAHRDSQGRWGQLDAHVQEGEVMTRHFCSYADSAYLPRLKALYASMQRHCGDFVLHVLCWDGTVYRAVMMWPQADPFCTEALFIGHPELALDKLPGPPRTRVEHMWTCGPQMIANVMQKTGQPVTYVDSAILFHSSPEPM